MFVAAGDKIMKILPSQHKHGSLLWRYFFALGLDLLYGSTLNNNKGFLSLYFLK